MVKDIRFGTDGWRAIIAEDFTFANVARCAQGLADFLKSRGTAEQGLVVGYDTRFLSRQFAEKVAGVCAGNGVKVYLAREAAPTPVISFNVLEHRAGGAAILTASHNPAIWNGFKFKPEYAGSATQEITDRLEDAIAATGEIQDVSLERARGQGLVVDIDPAPPYLERIGELVDLRAIRNAGLRVAVDAMFGSGGGYLPALISGGSTTVEEMNGLPNPAFPGMEQPEPIAHNLTRLIEKIKAGGVSVGLALDGDADRIGVVDEDGRFVTTLEVFSVLALYLLEHKAQRGPLVKGVTSSMMLNKLGRKFGVDVHEMRVGFKYIGPKMTEVDAVMGGEESGGFAFRGHIPERDGVLSGLYLLEYMAQTGKTPAELVNHLFDQVGIHSYSRRDVSFDPKDRGRIEERLRSEELSELAGMPVRSSDEIDGRRLVFDDAWLVSRFSGTEPLLRIYAEAAGPDKVEALLNAAAEYLGV
ncbi:MAG: phosphoglucomutase/phosphomannomutase family protein [Dehalococcoidia bacterium]|jgi:phosphomannomutase|nr:phosphoglucomutase/phosphomannomutase family protein [Dehalococcoidia bacterium]MDP7200131.1 phosphoglucomutase/phosphomannomutase family protein [Dehalococcoidia bacterium]MDP7509666.1 phosphoglucomutase/phosphomannomutase family protein [Dehalococcoidia bacterium]